jgi:biotin carboxyl carrier protein
MDYEIRIGEAKARVEAEPFDETGRSAMAVDGQAEDVRLAAQRPHFLRLEVAGRAHNIHVVRATEGSWIWCDGRARLVEDGADRRRVRRGGAGGLGQQVTPPMPAVVVKILVEVGQAVEAGQGLVAVQAMKMETTLVAPHPGTVSAINTDVGARVNPGEILVDIEPAGGGDDE